MLPALKQQLLARSSSPYRQASRFDHGWARGKLNHDPVFTGLLAAAIIPNNARIMDLGCGRGLLGSWLLAAEEMVRQGLWSAALAAPPQGIHFEGVELMEREAECGNRVLKPLYGQRLQLHGGDMCEAQLEGFNVITMLDVIHYIAPADQDRLLDRIRAALPPEGRFIIRVGDANGGWPFRFSQFVDRCMSFAQGHRLTRMWCRPVSAWIIALEQRGFTVQSQAMNEGTPFANVLLIGQIR